MQLDTVHGSTKQLTGCSHSFDRKIEFTFTALHSTHCTVSPSISTNLSMKYSKFGISIDYESAPMIGRWIGYKIVKSYLKSNNIFLGNKFGVPITFLYPG